jgi:peptide/nickel transport system ATP-binding protein
MLDVRDLRVAVRRKRGWLPILEDVNLSVGADETLAIVGESGSGKSMLALAITGLLLPARSFRVQGRVEFEGRDLLALAPRDMARVRGSGIGMMFQEALGALNPVLRIGEQIVEAVQQHRAMDNAAARAVAAALLREVGIPSPERRLEDYPHQLSGGMRQRVMIAMVLACEPRLVIADEPTTSLDVTIQSQILSVLRDLRRQRRMSMIFISHNLGAVAAVADRIAVMYAGQVVETADAATLLRLPTHPYTRDLLAAIPRVDQLRELRMIGGTVPRFDTMPSGCRFAPRCALRAERCAEPQALVGGAVLARCWRAGEGALP